MDRFAVGQFGNTRLSKKGRYICSAWSRVRLCVATGPRCAKSSRNRPKLISPRPSDGADSGQLISEPKTLTAAPLTVHHRIGRGRGLRILPGKRANSPSRLADCPYVSRGGSAMEDNQIDKVEEAIAGWRGRRSGAASSTSRWDICEPWSQQRSSHRGSGEADQQVDPDDRQEESSVLLIRHYEAREQPTGVPWFVTPRLQREILETRPRSAKLRRPGLVMLLALPGLVFLAGGAMAQAQEISRPILSSGLRDATHVQTQTIAKPVQSPLIKSPTGATNLPPIGSIGAGSDIRPFLPPGVP